MKTTIDGLMIYNFTNEYRIYDGSVVLKRVWKTTDSKMNRERLAIAIQKILSGS